MDKLNHENKNEDNDLSQAAIIEDVISNQFQLFDTKTMADYDAEFSGELPYLINIWTKQEGKGYGYIILHDFFRRVGVGNSFFATDFTGSGAHLFEKAIKDGVIQKEPQSTNLLNITRWKVVAGPLENLKKLKVSE